MRNSIWWTKLLTSSNSLPHYIALCMYITFLISQRYSSGVFSSRDSFTCFSYCGSSPFPFPSSKSFSSLRFPDSGWEAPQRIVKLWMASLQLLVRARKQSLVVTVPDNRWNSRHKSKKVVAREFTYSIGGWSAFLPQQLARWFNMTLPTASECINTLVCVPGSRNTLFSRRTSSYFFVVDPENGKIVIPSILFRCFSFLLVFFGRVLNLNFSIAN